MERANKIKLGAFVIIATTMIAGSFFVVGITKIFEPRFQAMTVLNTSVEGLSAGSPVKYMGVPVGRISRISMRDTDGFIDVYFSLFPSSIDMVKKNTSITPSDAQSITGIVEQKNLACLLNASGIMGGAYLELTISEGDGYAMPTLEVVPPPGVFYIKSRTSHVTNVIQNISQTLEQLKKVNYVQLAEKFKITLDCAEKILNNQDMTDMLSRFNRISKDIEYSTGNLREAFTQERVQKLIETVDYLENGTKALAKSLPPEKIEKLANSLSQSLEEIRTFFRNSENGRDKVVGDIGELKDRMVMTLTRLDRSLNAVAELISSVENDPNQFFTGKKDKPVFTVPPPQLKK